MTIKIFSFPQLILTRRTNEKGRFLERLTCESERPHVNVMVMDDFKKDSRINLIKFMTDEKNYIGSIYYSKAIDNKEIITLNLGYSYSGPIFTKNYGGEDVANAEHWFEEGLREKHIERINKLENIKPNLNPEEVAEEYKNFFYNLQRFI